MAGEGQYIIGCEVRCSDGPGGHLTKVVVDPIARAVRYLVVAPKRELAHRVPIELVTSVKEVIQLSCTRSELEDMPMAEEKRYVNQLGHDLGHEEGGRYVLPHFELRPARSLLGPSYSYLVDMQANAARREVIYDRVPVGQVEVKRGDQVHATDGPIGEVRGLVIDPADHGVTHVLLEEGHLWGHKEVAIPIIAVTTVDAQGAHLSLTKNQVRDLPSVPVANP
jgi:hypothetical protein